MFTETLWVRENEDKISPDLAETVLDVYRVAGWVPRIFHSPARALKTSYRKLPVVVQVDPDHWAAALNADNLGGMMGCEVRHKLDFIGGFSADVSVKTLQRLVAHEAVQQVWHDREIKILLDSASPVVGAPRVWSRGLKGKGVGIAVLDTGIYPHPDLTTPHNRIIGFKDFIDNRKQPYDDNGHGTHCAGDAAGNGAKSEGRYRGPAPEANLIGIKVMNSRGSGLMSDILAGVQWCINNRKKYGIKVLSMSIGSEAKASYRKDPLCRAVEKAWQAGIVVCVAAGNSGPHAGTIASPGIDPKIITVGALDDGQSSNRSKFSIPDFSGRGPTIDGLAKPDVVAPGTDIVSLRAGRHHQERAGSSQRLGRWYVAMTGTSMATPMCAGVVAILLDGCPHLTPDRVKSLLMSTADDLGKNVQSQGSGLIDALAAYRKCRAAEKEKSRG